VLDAWVLVLLVRHVAKNDQKRQSPESSRLSVRHVNGPQRAKLPSTIIISRVEQTAQLRYPFPSTITVLD